MSDLSDEAKDLLVQFQSYQQQLQNVYIQKENLKIQEMEIEKALEELENTKQSSAYKIVGNVMVSKTVDNLKKDLSDNKEDLTIKTRSMDTMENKLREKLKDLQNKLKNVIKE
ncbi:MAG TPA: prefoldin subunit beta [archaeon]|nr:prefoldin subunit beta [archaeon]